MLLTYSRLALNIDGMNDVLFLIVFLYFLQARLSEPGLTYLLRILSRIPEILGEGVMFGGDRVVARGVFSCLQAGGGRLVTEEVWMSWASREPPELVWLTTSYRQFASSRVQHPVRCSACHAVPIVGMRYQCLQCLSYDPVSYTHLRAHET